LEGVKAVVLVDTAPDLLSRHLLHIGAAGDDLLHELVHHLLVHAHGARARRQVWRRLLLLLLLLLLRLLLRLLPLCCCHGVCSWQWQCQTARCCTLSRRLRYHLRRLLCGLRLLECRA
jgi:hypothetical protein